MLADPHRRKRTRGIECMRIEKVVGSGTFGVVYKAVDKTDNSAEVALKRIKMERETQGFPVTAIREIRILNLMRNHPNIVHLREIVIYDENQKDQEPTLSDKKFETGDVFMVFEFVEYDLSGLLKSSGFQLTEQHAKCYLQQLLAGVKYLHDNGVLHRDIKSANLLVTKNNVLKVADWGLARTLPEDIAGTAKLTNPVVTLWYRSPEVIVGSRRYNKGVDIWSVG
jgi:serine/threonine protein kinase